MSRAGGMSGGDRLGELFERLLALPPQARPAFLDAACAGDSALRDELTSLLCAHCEAPDFLEILAAQALAPMLARVSSTPLPSGGRVGRYEIIEKLGSGGMGDVYKARDRVLDRFVALKLLSAHRSADAAARARLVSEARAASALDHGNIAVVYEIAAAKCEDSPGERLFIAMAYYDGEALDRKIARGPLPIGEALDYATQLLDGLARAHEAGIVHRDIKPANVLVTARGQVRIVDFGVALSAGDTPASDDRRTGTPAYMSPEQASGGPIDQRADLWATGALLYEMLTGVRPFRGDTDGVVLQRIRTAQPASIRELRPDVPPELARIVRRCLAKQPALRPRSARELQTELRSAVYASGMAAPCPVAPDAGDIPSLLVLPFANLDADAGHEYFSDGITEEVIGELSRIGGLRLIARRSSMRLKGSDLDAAALAHQFGVRYTLEGAVRRDGNAVRISSRLTDTQGDAVLWARAFDGTISDAVELQAQVARAIVDALPVRLSPEQVRRLSERPVVDARAYDACLRARYEAWRFSREGLARATRYIEAALELVGDNELLYGTLGHIHAMHLEAGIRADEGADTVGQLAARIFALNPHSARGHWLSAFSAFQRGDMRAAVSAGERSHACNPDDSDSLLLLGYVYAHVGRTREARALLERAVELDPLTPLTQCMPGFVAVMEGRFADALEPYRRLRRLDPESPFAAVTCGWVLAYNSRLSEATALLDDAADRFNETAFGAWARALSLALRGDAGGSLRAITPAFESAAHGSEMFARALAQCYALGGHADHALRWLEHAVDLGMLNHAFLAEHDRFLAGIRDDPRFGRLLHRVRLAVAGLDPTAATPPA